MLLNININDLAVVDKLDLDLETGMSVLTGETGAGKSILLTALGLALGDRADAGYIRPHSKRAEINIEFGLGDAPLAQKWLEDNELDDEQHCLIRRIINQDGRSKAYINNRPVTLQTLQGLSRLLVEIHGQHAHLTLLNGEEQRRLLDSYAGNQALLEQINTVYQTWKQLNRELNALVKASEDQTEREELLRYQLDELQQLDLENFNYQALSEEHNTLANLGQILSVGQQQLDLLYENEQQSMIQMLSHSIHELTELSQYSSDLGEVAELLNESQIQIAEASQQLRRYLEAQEADPQRLSWLDEQIGIILNLSRKHHVDAEKLPEVAMQIAEELDNLTHSSERIDKLQEHCEQLLQEYAELADKLSQKRKRHGVELADKISAMIQELGMPHGEFIVDIKPQQNDKPTSYGNDNIEFLVSANPGLPAKPLAKVASGGELSRISLAIQVTTSTDKTTPTMIFDEVDSGIGGGIAEIVGQKMRRLSDRRQVMCVTHLPQVAAQAHHHLFVAKNNSKNMTSSSVRALNREERVAEIARMLGGVNMTDNTLAHAEEMLNLGDQHR
ncbi:DNA repair protein RecN [Methylomarinum sp. Ch1-1]|uniref:DNA repair protein RecN n=1 Tax=Methylomarinum roseum TaxID=3067653 RepID=A0AAU7NT27_9GAMM|nr:DNA repair protein RecN [Methylomarinum sp. Ch1-1]MDP4519892.1 DNA repair protein RecN [Methylomarinum sp. Ch1-1]